MKGTEQAAVSMSAFSSLSVCDHWAFTDKSRTQGQRPSQRGFNRPSESSAVSEIPQENTVCPVQMENLLVLHTMKGEPSTSQRFGFLLSVCD